MKVWINKNNNHVITFQEPENPTYWHFCMSEDYFVKQLQTIKARHLKDSDTREKKIVDKIICMLNSIGSA